MKSKFFATLTVLLASIIIIGCDMDRGKNYPQILAERAQQRNDSIIAMMADSFIFEKDEFEKGNYAKVYPKTRPDKSNVDAIWSTFTMRDGKPSYFKVIVQCSPKNSVHNPFKMTFNTDGRVSDVILLDFMKHESRNGNFYQIPSAFALELLDSIGSRCESAKMKVTSFSNYAVIDCKPEELLLVKRMYGLYRELGGELESPREYKDLY